ncbi:thioredoxin 1 [Xanthomonas arboricola]
MASMNSYKGYSMTFVKAADLDFAQDVVKSEQPVLLKFSADWCAPCKSVAPVIESLAKEYADEMKFVSVDIDDSPHIAEAHGVRGVPAFVVVKDGKVTHQLSGLQTRTRLAEFIEAAIGDDR